MAFKRISSKNLLSIKFYLPFTTIIEKFYEKFLEKLSTPLRECFLIGAEKMNEWEKDTDYLVNELAKLTGRAFKEAKEKGVEPEMLNAIRENLKFIITYSRGDF